MRKDAVQARMQLKKLGFVEERVDSAGHVVMWHPEKQVRHKLSMSPQDRNAARNAVREARALLDLPPLEAARKRRGAAETREARVRARARERAAEVRVQQQAQAASLASRIAMGRLHDAAVMESRLRELSVILRECRTPAERAAVEMRIRPLACQRLELLGQSEFAGRAERASRLLGESGRPGLQ